MYIIQSCKVRFLISQASFPEVVPDLSTCQVVEFIDPLRSFLMKEAEHLCQVLGPSVRRVSHKVIVI